MSRWSVFGLLFGCGVLGCSGSVTQTDPADSGDGDVVGDGDRGGNGDSAGDGDSSGGTFDSREIRRCASGDAEDFIDLSAVSSKDGGIVVEAGHSSGCAKHSYALCFDPEFAESEPVQVRLKLLHDDGGEMCEAYEMVSLSFGLGALEEEYKSAYRAEGGEMTLRLQEQSILHSFGSKRSSWESVDRQIEAFNHCEVLEDCVGISTRPCETAYLNASEETGPLEEEIRQLVEADYGDGWGCTADCPCGVLLCDAGRCVARPDACDGPIEGKPICL